VKYYESRAYGKVCEDVCGIDLKQRGTMTKPQLDILLSESNFNESHSILDVGCGAGQIALYINQQTCAKVTGIDVDEDVISWAIGECKGNDKINFRVLDVRNISKTNEKFHKILAIDSLYFLSDMKIETFFESLKTTVKDLHGLLNDGGELIVAWSELPFFKPDRKEPECTQFGICLNELGYAYRSIDLTDQEVAFWKAYRDALLLNEKEFISEDNKDLYDASLKEAEFFIEGADNDRLYRNLYFIKK